MHMLSFKTGDNVSWIKDSGQVVLTNKQVLTFLWLPNAPPGYSHTGSFSIMGVPKKITKN